MKDAIILLLCETFFCVINWVFLTTHFRGNNPSSSYPRLSDADSQSIPLAVYSVMKIPYDHRASHFFHVVNLYLNNQSNDGTT